MWCRSCTAPPAAPSRPAATPPPSDWGGPDPLGGLATPASNIFEKQVVFGATARLREQIKNTAKVVDGELLVVLSSCATEMIGDDVPAMAKEARDQGLNVLSIASAGFRGSGP